MPVLNLFETISGFACAAALTPDEAAAHAHDFEQRDLLLLTGEALLAVARVRPLRCRLRPPPPLMPRPFGRRVARAH